MAHDPWKYIWLNPDGEKPDLSQVIIEPPRGAVEIPEEEPDEVR